MMLFGLRCPIINLLRDGFREEDVCVDMYERRFLLYM